MKQNVFSIIAMLLMAAMGAQAQITQSEPVITDSYIAFGGENVANNYRFTIDTYEWADRGPQFQLTVEPIDTSKPAQFTSADLNDDNYWEPMFRRYTKQMAGEEMTAQNNVKRLYVKNVALLSQQFYDYENFKIISIEAEGDYVIPDGCFSGCSRLESFDCNVQGTLTLGTDIVSTGPAFTVKVYTTQGAQVWKGYKENTGASFLVDDSGVIIQGGITQSEPVITDSYIAFGGENVANNYRFTIDTYEWADRGPQFQLTVEPIDTSKPAQFTSADLNDDNYWEPMFRRYTKQMAGEEMTAQNNVKRLYVKNVALLSQQFYDYENFKIISIEAEGDYVIPDGCFSGCSRLESFDCNVQGTLTLGTDIVSTGPAFTVKVYTTQGAQVWKGYKENTRASFLVDDSDVIETDAPQILSVSLSLTANEENRNFALPDKSGDNKENTQIVKYVLNGFEATTSGSVTELIMDYCVYSSEQSGQQHEWKQLNASNKGEGKWKYEGTAVNCLDGLQSNTTYCVEFSFKTNNDEQYGRSHFPSDGHNVRIAFTTGDLTTGIRSVETDVDTIDTKIYDLSGRRLMQPENGVFIVGGKKIIVK